MGEALHPIARERIEAAYNKVREIALDDLPEALFNGEGAPSEFVDIGVRLRAAGEATLLAAGLPQVRVEGPDDEKTCATCRAALGAHHLLDGGKALPPFHRCENLEDGKNTCRCRVVPA